MTATGHYEIGWGRPPKAYQFKPGFSGNAEGGKKRRRAISVVISAALLEKVTVNQNGRRRTLTKLEAACTQLANKAAAGDRHAAALIIKLLHETEAREEAQASGSPMSTEERRASDAAILAAVRDSAINLAKEPTDDDVG